MWNSNWLLAAYLRNPKQSKGCQSYSLTTVTFVYIITSSWLMHEVIGKFGHWYKRSATEHCAWVSDWLQHSAVLNVFSETVFDMNASTNKYCYQSSHLSGMKALVSKHLQDNVTVSMLALAFSSSHNCVDVESFLQSRLTKQVGVIWDGEFITGWNWQRSHHSDVRAHPLIHSGSLSGSNSESKGLVWQQRSVKPLLT